MTDDYEPNFDLGAQLRLFDIQDTDLDRVAAVGKYLKPKLEETIEAFYRWLPAVPEFNRYFTSDQILTRVKNLQIQYWQEFFGGVISAEYVDARRRTGNMHATIGLPLPSYFAAVNQMRLLLVERLEVEDGQERAEIINSLSKLINFDASIVASAFTDLTTATIAEQSEAIMAMSTPVATIWDDILLLPVVGIIDSRRAQDIMAAMLTRIRETEARVFILDVGGVAAVDTAVANHLIKMAKAARLMGCECILSGVSPAIARTMVELGIDVRALETLGTLKNALAAALDRTGVALQPKEG